MQYYRRTSKAEDYINRSQIHHVKKLLAMEEANVSI